jgi:Flp pilus assembly protein TadD
VAATAVIGGWTWLQRLIRSPGPRRLLAALLAAQAVALFGIMTILRNDDYRSGIRIWQDTAAKRPGNDRAWHNLGVVLAQAGKAEPAVRAFERAQQLEPARADTASCLCLLLNAVGRAEEGMRQCERSLALDPGDDHNLGIVHARAGRRDEAIPAFQEAIRLRPGLGAAHSNLGTVLAEEGRLAEALAHLRRAKELDPNLPDIDTRIRYVEERQ